MAITPIGFFDSGFGGLSIYKEIKKEHPEYDYVFLGDNARAPYGNRSFEEVFEFTWAAVQKLFSMGCPLVILACNTASAKALRNIQQNELPFTDDPTKRVLGVIRPTVEYVGNVTRNGHIGLVATQGTINSNSYTLELEKTAPDAIVVGHACPQWVPLIEKGDLSSVTLYERVKYDLNYLFEEDPYIDTLILGCTHYPLIWNTIERVLIEMHRSEVTIMAQGKIVERSLTDYLRRHPEMEQRISKGGHTEFFTTGHLENFNTFARLFLSEEPKVFANQIEL